jgi:hypothetical protein
MCLNIHIPDEPGRALRDAWGDALERQVLEAALIEAYRQGEVSSGYVGDALGIGVIAAIELITSRGVPFPLDHGDIDAQVAAMEAALARHKDSPR